MIYDEENHLNIYSYFYSLQILCLLCPQSIPLSHVLIYIYIYQNNLQSLWIFQKDYELILYKLETEGEVILGTGFEAMFMWQFHDPSPLLGAACGTKFSI